MADELGLSVEVNNTETSIDIRVFSERLKAASHDLCKELGKFAEERMRSHAPHGGTGYLRSSIHMNPIIRVPTEGGEAFETTVSVDAPYAKAVNEGSGRYGPEKHDLIAPAGNVFKMIKDPNADRHSGPNTAGVVFSKVVKGQRPTYFVQKAAAETEAYTGIASNFVMGTLFHK